MQKPLCAQREGFDALIVTRDFTASRTEIWRAFTDAAMLQRWLLGPPGWEMKHCHIDPRQGGGYEWTWIHEATGMTFGFTGQYSEVRPLRLMVDTQTFHQGDMDATMGDRTRNTVTFEDAPGGGGTRVMTRIVYPDAATRELVLRQKMTDGMEMSYLRLDELFPMYAQTEAAE